VRILVAGGNEKVQGRVMIGADRGLNKGRGVFVSGEGEGYRSGSYLSVSLRKGRRRKKGTAAKSWRERGEGLLRLTKGEMLCTDKKGRG